jgi:hypothetical protein
MSYPENLSIKPVAAFVSVLVFAAALALPPLVSKVAAQSAPPGASSADSSPPKAETITGRVSAIDLKAGSFKVRNTTGKSVTLKASKDLNLANLRRGERVVATYADGIALTVQATRNEKSH